MKDTDILKQLLQGNHLEPYELEQAKVLIKRLENAVQQRKL